MIEKPEPTEQPTVTPPGAPTAGAPPTYGPALPTPMLNPAAGLTGRARWDQMVSHQLPFSGSGMWGHDFNQWVYSLKDDPNDPEYNQILVWARNNAKRADEGRATNLSPGGPTVGRMAKRQREGAGVPESVPPTSALHEPKMGEAVPGRVQQLNEVQEQKRAMQELGQAPGQVFIGTPATTEGLATPTGEDALLAQFMSINGKPLTGSQGEMAKRSGAFVYMGIRTGTTKSGYNYNTDQWMYVQDAEAGLVALGATKVKEYQGALQMDQTGIPDNDLQGLWKQAVKQAQLYAQAGLKLSVVEIFDSYVKANADAMHRRGGGGGGGFIGETPEDVAAIDYYKAMMAVLGDISGLPTPGGRG